jgi:hypothetical protein
MSVGVVRAEMDGNLWRVIGAGRSRGAELSREWPLADVSKTRVLAPWILGGGGRSFLCDGLFEFDGFVSIEDRGG